MLKHAVDFEAELKSCVGMPGVMTAPLGSRWLRNSLGPCVGGGARRRFGRCRDLGAL